ncbi:hypothetical protein CAEBREN_10874 [Caenorhabditis brenneri]|uniref:ribonuclease H n=1 Tax=Caenorhabditis brenneri TaxID=135651 RepID=G0P1M8_CAEBE|nr:hypothetical protein CAEBREN_10874 [Caenorhabditis brenneri]
MNRLTAAYRLIHGEHIARLGITKFQKQYPSVIPKCVKYKVIAEVSTDGSCSFNGKLNARAAFAVWWGNDPQNNHSEKVEGTQESNRAELVAAGYCAITMMAGSVGRINLNSRKETQIGNTKPLPFLSLINRRNTIDFEMNYSERVQSILKRYGKRIVKYGFMEFIELFPHAVPICIKYKVIAKVYTDGSCHLPGTPNARAGFGVYWGDGHPNNVSGKVDGIQENNRAELLAAVVAICQAVEDGCFGIKIQTDSEFVIMAINKVIDFTKPAYNGKYQDLMEALDALRKEIYVCVQHVKAHSGILGNEKADRLANDALKPEKVNKLAGSVKNKTQKKAAKAKRSKAPKVEENGSGSKNNKKEMPKLEGKKN